jgi:hypothetical protein
MSPQARKRIAVVGALAAALAASARTAGALEAPLAPAGSQAAPLDAAEAVPRARLSLATGAAARLGGMRIDPARQNPVVLLYFAGQADGLLAGPSGTSARLRFRLFTGGERDIYVPSDGEVEVAYGLGRRELRFVVARAEAGRYPAIGLEVLAQAATLPSFEGSLPLAGDAMRLHYAAAPVEASFVRYHGAAHVPGGAGWASESDRPVAASAARLRLSLELPPAITASAQGEVLKLWRTADLLLAAEAGVGWQALERTALFSLSLRWNRYERRGLSPGTSRVASEALLVLGATLAL